MPLQRQQPLSLRQIVSYSPLLCFSCALADRPSFPTHVPFAFFGLAREVRVCRKTLPFDLLKRVLPSTDFRTTGVICQTDLNIGAPISCRAIWNFETCTARVAPARAKIFCRVL